MKQLELLLKKELSKEWIEKNLWLSTYNQLKILDGWTIKRSARKRFFENMKWFINELEDAHFEDIL